ncbi:MAG TPA: alkaline phosphatase family protein [Mycobacteriales bacterium]|nr:alkaline phosphatase family protein [Mycobacteriales bacterium]
MARRRRLGSTLAASALLVSWPIVSGSGLVSGASAHPAATQDAAAPHTNLLLNPGAEAGAANKNGWATVTIPGWRVVKGLPTVVRYGDHGFPGTRAPGPRGRGGQMFVGGAGGSAVLAQTVRLQSPSGRPLPAGVTFLLSGWLGGTSTSHAALGVRFFSAAGRRLGTVAVPALPTDDRKLRAGLTRRAVTGVVPSGARRAVVDLRLDTTLTDDDGYYAPEKGYDRATADDLSFSLGSRARKPARLAPPAAHIPRYQHVFLYYFENEDFHTIVGNTKQAPFFNSLIPQGSLLANFFAEEHPSDGNYVALAGGSTFGMPLDDPLEENPTYSIDHRNLGDEIVGAHETWKQYAQSANGPCDDTVHDSYWDDDAEMMNFRDVRTRYHYCAQHLVPLEQLRPDLAHTSTTPSFSWVVPNDCTDMEGCGIASGDRFLASTLGAIMHSPAWTSQRSLAIITFDEDAYDHERPAQRVATLVLGSKGVRKSFVSHTRYTHYSLGRTIERALGLPPMTDNDKYAQPLNDVFTRDRASPGAVLTPRRLRWPALRSSRSPAATQHPGVRSTGGSKDPTAWVVNQGSGTVTAVDLITHRRGSPIPVGRRPTGIVTSPDGSRAYVLVAGAHHVAVINTVKQRLVTQIPIAPGAGDVGHAGGIAITPDGSTVYAVNAGSDTVTPISTATETAGTPIPVGRHPLAIAVNPTGSTAYVLDWLGRSVTPIDTATNLAGPAIPTGSYPFAIAFTPDGSTAYVANYGSNTVTPIDTATGVPGVAIRVGAAPDALAVTPDGKTVYVVNGDTDDVTPIDTATNDAESRIKVGFAPESIAIRSGTAYVLNNIYGSLTPIKTATGKRGAQIPVGTYPYPTAVDLVPGHRLAVTLGSYSGRLAIVNLANHKLVAKVKTGNNPIAVAFSH